MKNKKPKIYRMNEQDTVIAYSKKEAVDWYLTEYFGGDDYKSINEECERETDLSKGYWYNLPPNKFYDKIMSLACDEELRVSKWAGDPAYWVTFEHVLENLLDEIDIPGIICTTEW
jgi:hypothetical protein